MQRMGLASQRLILDGWDEDIALPHHNAIVVLASDLNMIHAYDRQTGALIWEAPTAADADTGVRYLLGVLDDILFAGGANELIAYDLKGEGRMIWTGSWTARDYLKDANAKSYGRGMVTPDAVYFPVDDAILKFNPSTGKPLGRVGVRLGYEGKVGNLYSDGERIWVINANRLLALENVPASENEDHPPAGAAPATPPEPAADDDRQPARPER
jgi:outer membrane protein assembly factor BamB